MKHAVFLFIALLSGTLQVCGENWIGQGNLRPADKTGKICSRTWEGLQISVPPGKEGNHCFFWFPRKPFLIPANTPVKVGAWMRTTAVAGVRDKRVQLGGRLGLSDGRKKYYMWMPGHNTKQWRYFQAVAKWPVALDKCTQNLFIAYNCSGSVLYDDIYFGPFTAEDEADEKRGLVSIGKGTPVMDGKTDDEMRRRLSVFSDVTETRKSVNAVLVTPYGLLKNKYSGRYSNVITFDDLFVCEP